MVGKHQVSSCHFRLLKLRRQESGRGARLCAVASEEPKKERNVQKRIQKSLHERSQISNTVICMEMISKVG